MKLTKPVIEICLYGAILLYAIIWYWYAASLHTWNIFQLFPSTPYDALAQSLVHGRVTIPEDSLWYEKIATEKGVVMYFGVFPALIRIPFLAAVPALYGTLGGLSCFLAASLSLLYVVLLLRTNSTNSYTRIALNCALIAGAAFGSPLSYLINVPTIYHEAIVWGVSFSTLSLLLTLRASPQERDHSLFASIIFSLCFLSRVTFGIPWLIYSSFLFVRNVITTRSLHGAFQATLIRTPIVIMLCFQGWYNYARFDSPLTFIKYDTYEQETAHTASMRKSFGTFSILRIPTALNAYLFLPSRTLISSFPYGSVVSSAYLERAPIFFSDNEEPFVPLALFAPWATVALLIALIFSLQRKYILLMAALLTEVLLVAAHHAMTFRYTAEFLPLVFLGCYLISTSKSSALRTLLALLLSVTVFFSIVVKPHYYSEWVHSQSMLPSVFPLPEEEPSPH